eukprot:5772702-Alexandrium_andersonii.AAC.1
MAWSCWSTSTSSPARAFMPRSVRNPRACSRGILTPRRSATLSPRRATTGRPQRSWSRPSSTRQG